VILKRIFRLFKLPERHELPQLEHPPDYSPESFDRLLLEAYCPHIVVGGEWVPIKETEVEEKPDK